MKIKPQGERILVKTVDKDEYTSQQGIVIVNNDLAYGEVVEVSADYEEKYKVGETVIYPQNAGVSEIYNGTKCLWLNCVLDIWGKVTKD